MIYFLGVAGTGMSAAAGLLKSIGENVVGSDQNIFSPAKEVLEKANVIVRTPYDPKNIPSNVSCAVIGNTISKGHPELEAILAKNIPITSFPAIISEKILKNKIPIVVAGTHGKTTTTSMIAWILHSLGHEPGYLIGGQPLNFENSYSVGKGSLFVIEGDEYDTAYFDKESKFLHYRPSHVVLNRVEYDHADIFEDIDAVHVMFKKLLHKIPNNRLIVNTDHPEMAEFINNRDGYIQTSIIGQGDISMTEVQVKNGIWTSLVNTKMWGSFKIQTKCGGQHNQMNFLQALGAIQSLVDAGHIPNPTAKDLASAIQSFQGVQRRLFPLANQNNIQVLEDFAHHPTATRYLLETLRTNNPDRRLIVAFEPKNATSRRNTFADQYADAFQNADQVLIGECPEDKRIPEKQRMNTKTLAENIGKHAHAYQDNNQLYQWLVEHSTPGDTVVFLSCGSFSGIQHQFARHIDSHP
ncbi:MAG: UDP-N-acetylmuramate--L-alanine ligase [Oligoflexales bacterium]